MRSILILPFFRKIKTTSRELEQLQQQCAQQFQVLRSCNLLDGALVTGISLVSGSNTVPNPLNRQLQGWIIVDRDSAATLYKTADTIKTITLTASASINISVWFF